MTRTTKIAIGTIAGLAVVGGAVGAAAIINDPTETVDAIRLGDTATGSTIASEAQPTDQGTNRQVVALEQLQGELQRGDDADDFRIGRTEVDFGPEEWILLADAPDDYNQDGDVGTMQEELDALIGTTVDLLVRFDADRDDADVYVINDITYRDAAGGPAPWNLPQALETTAREQLVDAAIQAVGPGATVVDIDAESGSDATSWELDVIASDGRDYEVRLSEDATVIGVQAD